MAYEIFLLPVPAGADPEEAGEALVVRLDDVAEQPQPPAADPAIAVIVAALVAAAPTLRSAPDRDPAPAAGPAGRAVPVTEMCDAAGIEVTVARTFARFRVPFQHRGDDADAVFDRLFRLLEAGAAATGWRAYDPQEAEVVPIDATGRDTTLEIYLSVMDQIGPGGAAAPAASRGPQPR